MPRVERCQCGGPMLPLIFSGRDRDRFAGRVCATCREVTFIDDERDAELECCCSSPDLVCVRWYNVRYGIGSGCIRDRRINWLMDEPGAELHYVT